MPSSKGIVHARRIVAWASNLAPQLLGATASEHAGAVARRQWDGQPGDCLLLAVGVIGDTHSDIQTRRVRDQ